MRDYVLIYLISYIITACIFGVICKHINESKGYYGGFAWGFLCVIGVIVVACKSDHPAKMASYYQQSEALSKLTSISTNRKSTDGDNWICIKCGRSVPSYSAGCFCGMKREESQRLRIAKAVNREKEEKQEKDQRAELNNIELLVKYKELLDMGVITTEEFEQKKAMLLSGKSLESGVDVNSSAESIVQADTSEWVCVKCGKTNTNERGTCYYCGPFKT